MLGLLFTNISLSSARDAVLAVAGQQQCTPAQTAVVQAEVNRLSSDMHPMFFGQCAKDTQSFVHMLLRNMKVVTPLPGACQAPSASTCQLITTFVVDCAWRKCHGNDLEGCAERYCSTDLSVAVMKDFANNKRPHGLAFPHPPRGGGAGGGGGGDARLPDNVCRDFVAGKCWRPNCRFTNQLALPAPPIPPPPRAPYGGAGRGG